MLEKKQQCTMDDGQDLKVEISVTRNIENEDSLLIIFDSYK